MVHWVWLVVVAMGGATLGAFIMCVMAAGAIRERKEVWEGRKREGCWCSKKEKKQNGGEQKCLKWC